MVLRYKARPGDFLRVCDRSGFTVWASDTRREWTHQIIRQKYWEIRHPQDYVRGREDNQLAPDSRPPGTMHFVGALTTKTTAHSPPGSMVLVVEATARMEGGDTVRVTLRAGDMYTGLIQTVDSDTQFTLTTSLPDHVDIDALVYDMNAVANTELG